MLLHDDMAEYFTDEFFPISGETYWTCVQCYASAKLAELNGELKPDEPITTNA